MAKFDKKKVRGETFGQDKKLVSNPNKPKATTKNSYDTTYQSPSHSRRKSVKVFEETYDLVEEIKYATKEKSNIDVYKKAIEYYAQKVLR
ncbi:MULTISPECIES: hypothetical protein [Staphylococcaceae]|uniref:hypothetical protein n=1 Tax=Staphylococcaceae TaxID=90964 RepID=UPI00155DC9C3|nr:MULTISPECIES: hypothetical protein [Staphylococcaceae]